jgi:tRNA G18 (ribose-2'-O)-methylase SpoU
MIKIPFVIADMNGKNVFEFSTNENVCLVIGNEANGVSEFMRNKATYTVKIPMENGMESLNAGVAAGILMYQLKK